MDSYLLADAVLPFLSFIDSLTNWYIRRSRVRFWSDEDSQDRRDAFETLYRVLRELAKIAAPFIPFISETLYQNLGGEKESVHLEDFPVPKQRDLQLEEEMALVQRVVSMGHSLRKEHALKVRQPLSEAHINVETDEEIALLRRQQHLILDELNVQAVKFSTSDSSLVSLVAKPNFRVLGKKVGPLMKLAKAAIEAFTESDITSFQKEGEITLSLEGKKIVLNAEDLVITRVVNAGSVALTDGGVTIALNTHLTPELIEEGMAREIVNKINTQRRTLGFEVTDRITVQLEASETVTACFTNYRQYIEQETLTTKVSFMENSGESIDINGELVRLTLCKETIN